MNYFFNNTLIQIGDRLIREKGGVLSKHHAVYVGNGLIAENHQDYGVRYAYLQEFLDAGKLVDVEHYNLNQHQQNIVLQNVHSLQGQSYDLGKYNCEHFVNHVLWGSPYSRQMKVVENAATGSQAIGATAIIAGLTKANPWLALFGIAVAAVGTYIQYSVDSGKKRK